MIDLHFPDGFLIQRTTPQNKPTWHTIRDMYAIRREEAKSYFKADLRLSKHIDRCAKLWPGYTFSLVDRLGFTLIDHDDSFFKIGAKINQAYYMQRSREFRGRKDAE